MAEYCKHPYHFLKKIFFRHLDTGGNQQSPWNLWFWVNILPKKKPKTKKMVDRKTKKFKDIWRGSNLVTLNAVTLSINVPTLSDLYHCFDLYAHECTLCTIWLYVLVMSLTHFRVNPHSIVAWMSRFSFLLEAGAKLEV